MNLLVEKFAVVGWFIAKMAVYMLIGMVFGLLVTDVVGVVQGKTHKRMIRLPENSVTQAYIEDLRKSPFGEKLN